MKTTNYRAIGTETGSVTFEWLQEREDKYGWLCRAIEAGHLENVMEAIGDECAFAASTTITTKEHTAERLRSVEWMIRLLRRRADALTVILRDNYEAPWSEVANSIDPDDPKRSSAQRRYSSGKERIYGIPDRGTELPHGFTVGERVLITAVSGPNANCPEYIGRTGTVHSFVDGYVCVSGLSSRAREAVMGVPGFEPHEVTTIENEDPVTADAPRDPEELRERMAEEYGDMDD